MNNLRLVCAHLFATVALLLSASAQEQIQPKFSISSPIDPIQSSTALGTSVAIHQTAFFLNPIAVVGVPLQDIEGIEDAGMIKGFGLEAEYLRYIWKNPEPSPGDRFGHSVAVGFPHVIAGTPFDDFGAEDSGSVYVFSTLAGSSINLYLTLRNPSPAAGDQFGFSVALSGNILVVGAPGDDSGATNAGVVHVFDLVGATPTDPILTIPNPNPSEDCNFGAAVAISGDFIVVGAPLDDATGSDSGVAYVYNLTSGTPAVPVTTLPNPSPVVKDQFGGAVAISGTSVVVGATGDDTGTLNTGIAYHFSLSSGTPGVPTVTFTNPSPSVDAGFGASVGISGTQIIIGVPRDDAGPTDSGRAYIYDLLSNTPSAPVLVLNNPQADGGDTFGAAVAIAGNQAIAGAPLDDSVSEDAGSAYLFNLAGSTPGALFATMNDPAQSLVNYFGAATALSGSILAIGATHEDTGTYDAGSVFIYDLTGPTPTIPVLTIRNPAPRPSDNFGYHLALAGTRLVVGVPFDQDETGDQLGVIYVYELAGPNPTTPALTLNNPEPGTRRFGIAMAYDDPLLVALPNGESGKVYVYDLSSPTPAVPVQILESPTIESIGTANTPLAISGSRIALGVDNASLGAISSGVVHVYDLTSPTPSSPILTIPNPQPALNDRFGNAVALSSSQLAVGVFADDFGATNSGTVYVFDLDSANPTAPVSTLHATTPVASGRFGQALALSGSRLVAGAVELNGVGDVYTFDLDSVHPTTAIAQLRRPTEQLGDSFGSSVSIEGRFIVVGERFDRSSPNTHGTVHIYEAPRSLAQKVLHLAGPKGKGAQVPGQPEGTAFATVSTPAIAPAILLGEKEMVAFQAMIRKPDRKSAKVIFGGNPGQVLAQSGQAAPGANGANFKSFGDPLVSTSGVAFSAKLSDRRTGIWTTAFGGGLQPVLLTGSDAPAGVPPVAKILTFSLRGSEIVALVALQRTGGVTASDDMALVRFSPAGNLVIFRENDFVTADGLTSAVSKFSIFTPAKLSPAQGRSHAEGVIGLNAVLADRRVVSLEVDTTSGDANVVAFDRDSSAQFYRSFAQPSVGAPGEVVLKAIASGAAPKTDEVLLLEAAGQDTPTTITDASEGSSAPDLSTDILLGSLSDPIINDAGQISFFAKLTGPKAAGLTARNRSALFWGEPGDFQVLARTDSPVPDRDGQPLNARFGAFKHFSLPDAMDAGPIFTAKLTGGRQAGVNAKNNEAIYALDRNGVLREILRKGQMLTYKGETKTVRRFTALAGGLPVGARRGFSTAGVFTVHVVFTDKTSAVVRLETP